MKKIISLTIVICIIFSFTGCKNTSENTDDYITITDHNDRLVTVPKNIERIAVVGIYPMPSFLAIFFDSADKIVAMPELSMTAAKNSILSELYPEILDAETNVANDDGINIEEMLKVAPDVVFYSANDTKTYEKLTSAGIPAIAISVNKWDYNSIETTMQWIELLSQMFPKNDKTKIIDDYCTKIYNDVQNRISVLSDEERAKVFFLFKCNDKSIMTSGDNFFGDWWADSIGTVNVAKEIKGDNQQTVNLEQIYKWNPEIMFVTNFTEYFPDDLYNNTAGPYNWSGISAVENKKVYKMPLGMYRSYTPGIDTPITLLWFAKTTYPDLFSDVDIVQETVKYYKEVFDVNLTNEQADRIFNPSKDAGSGF